MQIAVRQPQPAGTQRRARDTGLADKVRHAIDHLNAEALMSTLSQPSAKPDTSTGTQPQTAVPPAAVADARFPRPRPDPQGDWPRDVRLPDEYEEGEC